MHGVHGDSDMVCSEYFVDGIPTDKNPNPSLLLGYEPPPKNARRIVLCPEIFPANKRPTLETDPAETSTAADIEGDPVQVIKGDPVQLHGEPNHTRGNVLIVK